jgi:hypothetical protein
MFRNKLKRQAVGYVIVKLFLLNPELITDDTTLISAGARLSVKIEDVLY